MSKLTPAQHERLTKLIEECAEVSQAACKVLLHGYEGYDPGEAFPHTNMENLEEELGQLGMWIDVLVEHGDIRKSGLERSYQTKLETASKYLYHHTVQDNVDPFRKLVGI